MFPCGLSVTPPSDPSSWSTAASSIAPSAAEQMRADLLNKQERLAIAEQKANELKKRLKVATARLEAQAKAKKANAKTKKVSEKSNLKRKSAPPPTQPSPAESPSPAKKTKSGVSPFSDIMNPAEDRPDSSPASDDEVPPPEDTKAITNPAIADKAYEGLHSTLCADKAGVINVEDCHKTWVSG